MRFGLHFIPTHVLGQPLDWDRLYPVYAALEAAEVPIFLHPGPPWHQANPSGQANLDLMSALYFPVVDAHALLRLACAGVLERFPRLRIICPHLGGVLPFLIERIDQQSSPQFPDGRALPHPPSHYLRRVLYDTVSQHLPAFRCACDTFGADRLVFGSDFPFVEWDGVRRSLATLHRLELDSITEASVLVGTARTWLRLPSRAPTPLPSPTAGSIGAAPKPSGSTGSATA